MTWVSSKNITMTSRPIRGDPNEPKDVENSMCSYLCKHPSHLQLDIEHKKFLLDGQQRMKSLYYGLMFPCHQEIFRPKKTKTQPFTFIIYTENSRDFEVKHFEELINERYLTESLLLLKDLKIVKYGSSTQIEVIFHNFEPEKGIKFPTIWKYVIKLGDDEGEEPLFEGFITQEEQNIHQPTDVVLKNALNKNKRGILISSFVELSRPFEELENKTLWSYFFDLFKTIPSEIYGRDEYSTEERKRLEFEHRTLYKYIALVDKWFNNLLGGEIGEISISGKLNEMVVIFDKLNMSGMRLSTMDLLVAKTFAIDPDAFNLRTILSQFDNDEEILSFFGKDQFIGDQVYLTFLKAIALIFRDDLRERSILELNRNQLKEVLITNQEQINRAIDNAIEFFRSIPKLPHISYVRYETQVTILIAIYYNLLVKFPGLSGIRIEQIIRDHYLAPWYWRVVFPSRFGMSTRENARRLYNALNKLILRIATSMENKTYQQELKSFENHLDLITEEYRVPTFDDISELPDGRNFTPLNLLPFSETGSCPNLSSGIGDSLSNTTKNFQVHHIFPFDLHKQNPQITKLLIDHPLNMLIIDGGLNSHISNSNPDQYFREFLENYESRHQNEKYEDQVLKLNFIPSIILDLELSNLHGLYIQFLNERYELFKTEIVKLQRRDWHSDGLEGLEDISLDNFEIDGKQISSEHFLPKSHVRDILREESGMNVQGELIDYLSSHVTAIILTILKDHNTDFNFRKYWISEFDIDLDFIQIPNRLGSVAFYDRIRKLAGCKKNASLTDMIQKSYYYLLKRIAYYLQFKSKQQNMKTLMRRDLPDLSLLNLKDKVFAVTNL